MRTIRTIATQNSPRPSDPMHSYISLAVFADNTIIHYDHWEGGFESDIANPQNIYSATNPAGTQIWGDGDPSNGYPPGYPNDRLNAGSIILLQNVITSGNRRANGYSNGAIYFDGGDKLAANKPIAVTRMIWDNAAGTLFGDATEVMDTAYWGTEFRAPVGENIPQATQNQIFEYTGFYIMAGVGGATVQIDKDNNGTFETTVTLSEGQGYLVNGGVNVGGHIVADNPIQVELFTGDIDADYESRLYHLLPTALWCSSLTSPVSTPSSAGGESGTDTTVWLYNPGSRALAVMEITRNGRGSGNRLSTNSFNVAAGSYAKRTLTDGSGVRYESSDRQPFYAITAIHSGGSQASGEAQVNQAFDWGFSLIPDDALTSLAYVGLGIGRDPTSNENRNENASPVWITPVGNGNSYTWVYIDYDGDPETGAYTDSQGNRYDTRVQLRELERAMVYNPNGDQTGMLLYTLDEEVKLAVAWGSDPAKASTGPPGLDLGTVVPPFPAFVATKHYRLMVDADNDGFVSPGDILSYCIEIENTGRQPVPDLSVQDIFPAALNYHANSTVLVEGSSEVETALPDNQIGGQYQTIFPLDEGGIVLDHALPVRTTWYICYTTTIDNYDEMPEGTTNLINSAVVGGVGISTTNVVETPIYGKIISYVWHDQDEDGLQNDGNSGINGVLVELLYSDGTPVLDLDGNPRTAYTQNDRDGQPGYVIFTGMLGGEYRLRFAQPVGMQFTAQDGDHLGIESPINSDADFFTGESAEFTLQTGETVEYVDAGVYAKRGSISGAVRLDVNGNGVVDAPADYQTPLVGVTILLRDGDGVVIAETITDNQGAYLFAGLHAADYTVEQLLPTGYTNTYDVVGVNDRLIAVTLPMGADITQRDFWDATHGPIPTGDKVLYFSGAEQAMDRIDPVAAARTTTFTTAALTYSVPGITTGNANNYTFSTARSSQTFNFDAGTSGKNRILLVGGGMHLNDRIRQLRGAFWRRPQHRDQSAGLRRVG